MAEGEHARAKMRVFDSGAKRSTDADDVRYDLITPYGLKRIARTYAEGAKIYGDRNWEKGIPESELLNHAIRRIFLHMEGDTTEDDIAHAAWNLLAILHFDEIKKANKANGGAQRTVVLCKHGNEYRTMHEGEIVKFPARKIQEMMGEQDAPPQVELVFSETEGDYRIEAGAW